MKEAAKCNGLFEIVEGKYGSQGSMNQSLLSCFSATCKMGSHRPNRSNVDLCMEELCKIKKKIAQRQCNMDCPECEMLISTYCQKFSAFQMMYLHAPGKTICG